MIDFVDTPPFSHSPNRFIYGEFVFALGGPKEQFGTNSKLSFGCKVGQIRSRGRWFEAEISLFMMFFFMIFSLSIRLSLIFLNMQMKKFRIPA